MTDQQRTRIERKFVEGKGWDIREVPIDQPQAPDTIAVEQAPPGPVSLDNIPLAEFPDELLTRILDLRGLVAVPRPEYETLMAELADIRPLIEQPALASPDKGATAARAKGQKLTVEEMEQRIMEATDLGTLTDLMKDEKRKELLKLADERAAQIKAGEA